MGETRSSSRATWKRWETDINPESDGSPRGLLPHSDHPPSPLLPAPPLWDHTHTDTCTLWDAPTHTGLFPVFLGTVPRHTVIAWLFTITLILLSIRWFVFNTMWYMSMCNAYYMHVSGLISPTAEITHMHTLPHIVMSLLGTFHRCMIITCRFTITLISSDIQWLTFHAMWLCE